MASAEVVVDERVFKEEERFKKCIEMIQGTNGHVLEPKPDPVTGWARCLECARMASITSDKFWTRVSCNTNRGVGCESVGRGQYGNLPANKRNRQHLLAICDINPNEHKRLTNWEKERMEANRELALAKRAKRRCIDEKKEEPAGGVRHLQRRRK